MSEQHPEGSRDLAALDPWARSLERSLGRRNRRSPLQGWFAERAGTDLAESHAWADSLQRSRTRRRAAERNGDILVGRKKASVAALAAVAAPPVASLVGAGVAAAPAIAAPGHLVKRGSHGAAVARLQRALGIAADGIFGPQTRRALRTFQRGHGLVVDGIAGPATWSALRGAGRGTLTASVASAGRGLGGAATRRLQRALGIPADGIFGPQTEHAVRAFQRSHGLTVDGIAGPRTFAALRGSAGPRAQLASFSLGGERAGGSVSRLQHLLGVPADGVFGPETHRAVIRFQLHHGLAPDGVVGPATWGALGVRSTHTLHMRGGGRSSHTGSAGSSVIARVISAGNAIATRPYEWGGGHGSFSSSGYDCSGSVSYALHGGGLLQVPEDSSQLESYGLPGPGRHITIYANAGHAYMVVDGRRFDTSAMGETGGSRWTGTMRSSAGYVVRHPAGY